MTAYLQRYQKLFEETKQSLVENRESILETLVNIHEDLIQVTDNAGEDTADVQGEIRYTEFNLTEDSPEHSLLVNTRFWHICDKYQKKPPTHSGQFGSQQEKTDIDVMRPTRCRPFCTPRQSDQQLCYLFSIIVL